jgi:transposase-like protein
MRGVAHSPAFKAKMIEKMLQPDGPSATALAAESNVAQTTLSRWKREALTMGAMSLKRKKTTAKTKTKKHRQWTVEERLRLVHEASQLSEEDLGAFLRREGVHASQLEQWREMLHEAFGKQTPDAKRRALKDSKRIRALERDLKRKDKALAESAALLWLKKKAEEIWGDEDDDTTPRSGR